jgi:hypothetical protein
MERRKRRSAELVSVTGFHRGDSVLLRCRDGPSDGLGIHGDGEPRAPHIPGDARLGPAIKASCNAVHKRATRARAQDAQRAYLGRCVPKGGSTASTTGPGAQHGRHPSAALCEQPPSTILPSFPSYTQEALHLSLEAPCMRVEAAPWRSAGAPRRGPCRRRRGPCGRLQGHSARRSAWRDGEGSEQAFESCGLSVHLILRLRLRTLGSRVALYPGQTQLTHRVMASSPKNIQSMLMRLETMPGTFDMAARADGQTTLGIPRAS